MTRATRQVAALAGALLMALLSPRGAVADPVAGAFPHLEAWPSSLALAGIPEALGTGVEAVLENPTGMLRGEGKGLSFSHASLFSGGLVRHQAAALAWPRYEDRPEWREGRVITGRGEARSSLGLGVTNLSGDLPGSDSYGELQIALAYAQRAPLGLQSGMRLRFLQARSTVDGTDGGGVALDIGVEGTSGRWRAGGVARSLLSSVRWDRSLDDPLPRGFDLGVSRALGGGLELLAGAALLSSGSPQRVAVAAEWHPAGTPLILRSGPGWRDTGEDRRAEISGGLAIRVGAFTAAYAMRTGPPGLGEIHRFALEVSLR